MESVFHHVGIYCRDIEESIAFYEDVLGCRLLFESDAQEGDKPLKVYEYCNLHGLWVAEV